MSEGERRLAAIMFTDMVGYTALTQSNEPLALEVLDRHNRILRPIFPQFRGREVKTMGDSFLVEFGSTLDAVRCAVEIQTHLHDYNLSSKEDWKIRLRIGIHLGDVTHLSGDTLGDAVNIASRIEPVADPEGVCVSDQVFEQVRSKTPFRFAKLVSRDLKNVHFAIDIYKVVMPWEHSTGTETTKFPAERIAVLPFASYSPDSDDVYFADGMTDEIISTVSGISGLSVISRTSVTGYKGSAKNVRQIGTELEVGSILEGSVKKAGNRIRVTAQLIDVAGDKHLWAQNYDRDLDDVFAVQTDIAKRVAESLRVRILSPEMDRIVKKPTQNTDAYTLYLKARYLWSKRGFANVKRALEIFEQAKLEDPNYAPIYLGLADCYLILRTYDENLDTHHEKARANLVKASELDPSLAEAQAATGLLLMHDYHPRDAEEKFKRAIELKPSYTFAHMWYNILLVHELRWDEALDQLDKAIELDPFSTIVLHNYAFYYGDKGDHVKALELAKRAVELEPNFSIGHFMMGWQYGQMKQFAEMKRSMETFVELDKAIFPLAGEMAEAWCAYLQGDRETVKNLLPVLEAHPRDALTSDYWSAVLHFYLGEIDTGFERLESSYAKKESDLLDIRAHGLLDKYSSDPRYLDLLKRLGLDRDQLG